MSGDTHPYDVIVSVFRRKGDEGPRTRLVEDPASYLSVAEEQGFGLEEGELPAIVLFTDVGANAISALITTRRVLARDFGGDIKSMRFDKICSNYHEMSRDLAGSSRYCLKSANGVQVELVTDPGLPLAGVASVLVNRIQAAAKAPTE